jgi:hypothetical protein
MNLKTRIEVFANTHRIEPYNVVRCINFTYGEIKNGGILLLNDALQYYCQFMPLPTARLLWGKMLKFIEIENYHIIIDRVGMDNGIWRVAK